MFFVWRYFCMLIFPSNCGVQQVDGLDLYSSIDDKWYYKGANTQSLVVSNTVVSNHFHSVKNFLFSSAKPRDFDGMLGTGLPVSM